MQNEKQPTSDDSRKVGLNLDVTLVGLNGDNPLRAKVDTGAEECSLDAQNINEDVDEVTGTGTVTFSLGDYQYKMSIHGHQSISSADGGTKNRPTIKVGVRYGEEYIPDVVFNLNDRSSMDYPVLLGVSFLTTAKLVVDPSLAEAMEITFADEPDKEVVQGAGVDVSTQIQDNTSCDLDVEAFTAWYNANKSKTIGQYLAELMKTGTDKHEND